ncbi:nucleoside-diphosphate sugar epimerase/dehydratase [Butyrivibrio sp. MC2013]|uniref:nucleoside-diphosphate sugar epimerase/dehydratase n=1 Tax=Butyrivibrio sp. MC2013 TaxID=1280686 RepID=UPI000428D0D9|nr:hypothetical protein [Butyrivibrio sp. MC2013]
MSNPGVIKLASNDIQGHKLWIDDNIGESIHIHYDTFRIELSSKLFIENTARLKEIMAKLMNIDIYALDERFLFTAIDILSDDIDIKTKTVRLSELYVREENGPCNLPYCKRVLALKGELDINQTPQRRSNFYKQTNEKRLEDNLEYARRTDINELSKGIYVYTDQNLIIDGWHRAACLYHLYGDINVDINCITTKQQNKLREILPKNLVPPKKRIILYGAGKNGINCFKQLLNQGHNIVAWWDGAFTEIESRCGYPITAPMSLETDRFDFILITILNPDYQKDIIKLLKEHGITKEKILCV